MSSGMYFLALILCLLCGSLDIFMAATCYKEGKYFGTGTWLTAWVILLIYLGRIIMEY